MNEERCYRLRAPDEIRHVAHAAAEGCAGNWRIEAALAELLMNAIEHGNLGIDGALKARLLQARGWEREVARRLALPPHCERWVTLTRTVRPGRYVFEIEDQGQGFDWQGVLAAAPATANHMAACGRGIALARQLGFDDLHYLGNGSRVRASAERAALSGA